MAAAVVGACRLGSGWSSPAQPELLRVLFERLLGVPLDWQQLEPAEPEQVAAALPDPEQRHELIELLVMLELLCRPIPLPLQRSLERWAKALAVEDEVLLLARDLSCRSQAIATADFYRLNWIGESDPQDDPHFQALLEQYGSAAYALTVEADPQELRRWRALADCPLGSLGRGLWDFYQQRGFRLPGELGAGNAALAHHDWVHLLAGYDTTPIGELEVTAFMAAASRSRGAMLGFLGAVSIYETGLLRSVVLGADYAHTLTDPGAVERVAAAIRRGAACRVDPLLGVDYFDLADQPLALIRREWGLES
ncbi:MAG: hypothetical protein ACKOE9_07495 [Vulcanococcus sp.]